MKDKIALFCNVLAGRGVHRRSTSRTIYELPLALAREGLDDKRAELLNIWSRAPRADAWEKHRRARSASPTARGARSASSASTSSSRELQEPQRGAGARRHRQRLPRRIELHRLASEIEKHGRRGSCCAGSTAILVPGGFGVRGTEGKIAAIR